MSNQIDPPDPGLKAIEAALGALAPARSRIDRDLVMFRAGQASARSPRRVRRTWNAVAAGLGLVALGEAVLLAHRPPPGVVEKVVVVHEPAARPVVAAAEPAPVVEGESASVPDGDSFSLGQTAYGRLAGQVLRYGLDGLPASPSVALPASEPLPASSGRLMREEFRRDLDSGDPS